MSDTTTISIRITDALLERIEHSAAQAGTNRTSYIVSWLPENYVSPAETSADKHQRSDR